MPRRDRPTRAWVEAECHPVAWFSALCRAAEQGDTPLIDKARTKLERLGFRVTVIEPRPSTPEADRREVRP